MKIKDGYTLCEFEDGFVAVSDTGDSSGIISLNSMGAFLWKRLETERDLESLVSEVTNEYDVDAQKAKQDILKYIKILKNAGIIE